MYLDVGSPADIPPQGTVGGCARPQLSAVYGKWLDWPASQISHHHRLCCDLAREWVIATDLAELNGASDLTGPRWLRHRFKWGASAFPIYWCEAVKRKKLDCGALAALAHTVFKARGVQSYRAQMVQQYSEVSTFQWSNSWADGSRPLDWTDQDLIYHEGCVVLTKGNEIKVWDSSAGWWVNPRTATGYGSLLALRISDHDLRHDITFRWGQHELRPYEWLEIS